MDIKTEELEKSYNQEYQHNIQFEGDKGLDPASQESSTLNKADKKEDF